MEKQIRSLKIDEEFKSLIPPLRSEEYQALQVSILSEGLRDTILVWDDTIVDGHNRYQICQEYDIGIRTQGIDFDNRDDAKIWIINNQLARRNLTTYQYGELSLRKADIIRAKSKLNQALGHFNAPQYREKPVFQNSEKLVEAVDTTKELAEMVGTSTDTMSRIIKIDKEADAITKDKLRSGEISINQAYNDIRRQERDKKEREAKVQVALMQPPDRRYSTIIIDPPWPIQKILRDVRPNQAEFDYPTMTIAEIMGIDIANIAADDCHIFLWTVQKFLPVSFAILEQWGFRYIFTMVWHKPGGFQPLKLPQYNCEFVLYGRKGNIDFIETKAFNTCFSGQRREHSRKPDEFYDLLKRVTQQPRIDFFSREARDGFDQYGNETDLY